MKAALALVFLACIAGSMASDARGQIVNQLMEQGQAIAQSIFSMLQQQVLAIVGQAVGQLTQLIGSAGRFDFNILLDMFKPILGQLVNQALGQVMGGLTGLIGGGRGAMDMIHAALGDFMASIQGALGGIAQSLMNQGLAAVIGAVSGGRAGFGDIFASLSQHISSVVSLAQGALSGALGNLSAIGASILDASKPHLEQLQEQLVGHGLNVLGSLSETINNIHGSVAGGR